MFLVTQYEFEISSQFLSEMFHAIKRDGRAVLNTVYVLLILVSNDY